MTPENNRIAWVDCLKGIGILSVIFAHITGIKGVFIFSMPLFFVNAGYLFHPQPIKSYIAKLTQRIAVPYCVFLAFLSVLCFKSNVLAQGGAILYGGMELKGELGVFWFPSVLFLTLVIFNSFGLYKRLLLLCLLALPMAIAVHFAKPNLPLNIQSIPLAMFYVALGYIMQRYMPVRKFGEVVSRKVGWWMTAVAAIVVCVTVAIPNIFLDVKNGDYGIPVVSIVVSVLVVALLSVLSVKIAIISPLESFLSFCGRGSLFIMFVHQYIHFRIFDGRNVLLTLVGTVVLSLFCYFVASRFRITRRLFCGEVIK